MTITIEERYDTIEEAIASASDQQDRLRAVAHGLEFVSSTYISELTDTSQKRYVAATVLGGFLSSPPEIGYHLGYARFDGFYETVGEVQDRIDRHDLIETAEAVAECMAWRRND